MTEHAGPTEIWTLGDQDVGVALGPLQIERVETDSDDDPIVRFKITRRMYRVVRDELGRWLPVR